MNKLEELKRLADADLEISGMDMTEAQTGGGVRLLPEGYAFAQLVEYIEYGMQPQEFAGKAKDPALEFRLGFALTGESPEGEGFANPDGTPFVVRTFPMALSRNEKANSFRIFGAMNYKGKFKSFAQMLGEKFLIPIKHVRKSKTDATVVSRPDLINIIPPVDPVSKKPYPIEDAPDAMYTLFLWHSPTKAGWDALYIDGEFEGKSRNFVQEKILNALDFSGSALEEILLSNNKPQTPSKVSTAPVVGNKSEAGRSGSTPGKKQATTPVKPVKPALPSVPK